MYGYHEHKDDLLARLRKVEGQVRGVQKMVDQDVYCIDILTQIAAAESAMKKVAVLLLEDHLGHCVADAAGGSRKQLDAKVSEASAAIGRLLKA
jgi:CsoR family transcriptional regulator, copper-sensing transcriptional repressor